MGDIACDSAARLLRAAGLDLHRESVIGSGSFGSVFDATPGLEARVWPAGPLCVKIISLGGGAVDADHKRPRGRDTVQAVVAAER
jgi:hypothetical protein